MAENKPAINRPVTGYLLVQTPNLNVLHTENETQTEASKFNVNERKIQFTLFKFYKLWMNLQRTPIFQYYENLGVNTFKQL